MCKKILFSIVTTIILFITGVSDVEYLETDNSVEVKSESNNVIEETLVEVEEPKEESVTEIDINIKEKKEVKDTKPVVVEEKKEEKKEVVINNNEKENVAVKEEKKQTKETEVVVKEEKNNSNNNHEEKNEEKPIKVEEKEKKEEVTKETIEYNDTESKKMVNDINTIAKQNPDLWDASGNPLYKVEINKSAMNGEYMYPYRIELIKGKVLNVFPVKFLVYAVDVQKPGFEKEMKYYISMTSI